MLEKRTDSPDQSVEEIFRTYGNMLYRIAFVMRRTPLTLRMWCRIH